MAKCDFETALGSVKVCIYCGKTGDEVVINGDHYYPQVLGRRPRNRQTKHLFKPLIRSVSDVFPLCLEHHYDVDAEKIAALRAAGKSKSLHPVGLVEFLRKYYPITTNPQYYDLQVMAMIESNRIFIDLIQRRNGELPQALKSRYNDAAVCAEEYVQHLEFMRLRGPLSLIDFQDGEMLKYQHQTSVA